MEMGQGSNWWDPSKREEKNTINESSTELLRNTLTDWALLYGRTLSEGEVEQWMRIFARHPVRVLALALEYVTVNSERMPSPGHLTKAITLTYERHPELTPSRTPFATAGVDSHGVDCVYWSDAPTVPAYRAADCPEGQEFLSLLHRLGTGKALNAARGQRPYGTTECPDCHQSYQQKEFFGHVCPTPRTREQRRSGRVQREPGAEA